MAGPNLSSHVGVEKQELPFFERRLLEGTQVPVPALHIPYWYCYFFVGRLVATARG
jgi:hypothetical protein